MATIAQQRHDMNNQILKDFYEARHAGEDPSIDDLPASLQKVVIANDKASAKAKADRARGKADPNAMNAMLHDFYEARRAGLDPDASELPEGLQKVVANNDRVSARAKADRARDKADPNVMNAMLHDFYEARRAGKDPSVDDLPASLQKVVANNDRMSAKAKADRAARPKADTATLNAMLHDFYEARRAGLDPDASELPEGLQKVVASNDAASARAEADREAAVCL